jgi:hypothetical protein
LLARAGLQLLVEEVMLECTAEGGGAWEGPDDASPSSAIGAGNYCEDPTATVQSTFGKLDIEARELIDFSFDELLNEGDRKIGDYSVRRYVNFSCTVVRPALLLFRSRDLLEVASNRSGGKRALQILQRAADKYAQQQG